jgi:RNA polymerase sigma-70 factor (ECF subfamily)
MEAFDRIYDMYWDDFIKSASYKFKQVPREDIIDAWQDTVISFFEQIRSEKLNTLTCSLRSFLFLLGFRYILKYKRHYIKESATDSFEEEMIKEVSQIELESNDPWNHEKEMLRNAVEELPEQSRRLLILRYIDGKSIEEIMKLMQYTSVNAVSVTLSRNLKRLKEIIETKQLSKI